MKTRIFTILALAATMLTACNKNENETDNWNGEIRLSSGVVVQQTRTNNADVPDKQIADGQTVKVEVSKLTTDASAEVYSYSKTITAQGDGTFAALTPAMYYPQSGMGVSIYAYHPADAGASFSVKENQSADIDYFNSDLLYSAKADYPRQAVPHSLSFDHKLSKLTYVLVSGDGAPDITGATVEWKNVLKTVSFTSTTGAVGAANGTSVSIIPNVNYGAIIVPQTVVANTKLLKITLSNGGVLYYTPTTDQVFESKQKYHYTITVNLSGLSVQSSISDWDPVTNRNGTAEM